MEPDYIPYIPPEGLIKLRQIEPFSLNSVSIQLFVNALIQLFEGDFYQYWKIKGSTGPRTPVYGPLYNWFTVTSAKGIAPIGYRVPTSAEILTLVGSNGFGANCNELLETGIEFWEDPNEGTNTSGFSLRGNGLRDKLSGDFIGLKAESYLWTISEGEAASEAILYVHPAGSSPSVFSYPKVDGAGIRLIRDTAIGWTEDETVVDFDGNTYETVKIGDQVWTTKNLISEHFQDGTRIPVVEDADKWFALETEAMCYYQNDRSNGYSETPAKEIRIHKHDLLRIKDTDTLKWRINEISDTEIEIVVDGLVKADDIPRLQVQSDWEQTDTELPDFIKNKPELLDQVQSDWEQSDNQLPDFIKNKPQIPDAQVQSDWNQTEPLEPDFIKNKPESLEQIQSDWNQTDTLAVDFIKNKPDLSGTGEDGTSSYTYVAYASDAIGTDFTTTFNSLLDFIAIKTTSIPITSPVVVDFTGLWKNYKGAKGAPGNPGSDGNDGAPGAAGNPGADGADDHSMDVYIDFLTITPFVYNCPYALKFTAQISEGTGATLSVALNTNMTQFQKLTITPTQVGLIILKGTLL